LQRDAHLFLVGLGLRLDGDLDHRLGKVHGFSRMTGFSPDRTACRPWWFLQAASATMSPAKASLISFAVVRVHQHHAADALFLVLGRVQQRMPLFSLPE
jgi:hypothetical protein